MTEKRFTFADGFKIVAIRDNGEIMNSNQVCNKLNDLEEARSYYQENFLTMKTERNRLKEENKELKDQIIARHKPFEKELARLKLQNKEVLKNNAKLREENKELKEEKNYWKHCHLSLKNSIQDYAEEMVVDAKQTVIGAYFKEEKEC